MSRPMRAAVLWLAALSLVSCAIGPNSSYVGELSASDDARVLAAALVGFVTTQLPAGSTTIALDPTPADQASNALTPAFTAALRRRGFAVADDRQGAAPVAHHLRYWVTPLEDGDLVRLSIDDRTEGSRLFVRNPHGAFQAGGPFMVRQNAEASR